MADESRDDMFDIERLRQLAELMKDHALSEIDLQHDQQRIRLRRGSEADVQHVAPPAVSRVSVAHPELTAADAGTENIVTINSPMVGTFYAKPNPEAEAYVKVGDHVSADTIVCVVEAMKVFNEIPAEVSGQVIAVLVENEESVEFGKPLFKVDTSK